MLRTKTLVVLRNVHKHKNLLNAKKNHMKDRDTVLADAVNECFIEAYVSKHGVTILPIHYNF